MLILDTNICIYLIKKRPVQVFEKFKNIQNQRIGISIITFAELMYGAEKSAYPQKNKDALNEFISPFEIHDYSIDCIHHYAMIRSQLEKGGITIGSLDMLIASHVLALNATLVTNNVKEFSRIPNLKVENWI